MNCSELSSISAMLVIHHIAFNSDLVVTLPVKRRPLNEHVWYAIKRVNEKRRLQWRLIWTCSKLHTPSMSYAQAMGMLIEERFDMMMSYRDGTIDGSDPEDLHQMRVWSRRLRAAMDVSTNCFPSRYRFFHRRVKEITDVLGGVRDNDVMIEELSGYRDARPADERAAINDMIKDLRADREKARAALLEYFAQLERERFEVRFRGFVAEHTHG